MARVDIYQAVTARIVAAIESGQGAPWHRPWKLTGGYPVSLSTGKRYRGINVLLLTLEGRSDPRWGTYNAMREAAVRQAKAEGRELIVKTFGSKESVYEIVDGQEVYFRGGVRKGEKSTRIILWKPVKAKEDSNGEQTREGYMFLRDYAVFNATQADGLPPLPVEEEREFSPIERAEEIAGNWVWTEGSMNEGPRVTHGGDRAAYSIDRDEVLMPEGKQFESDEAYYQTLFHELVHSTGSEKRLKRIEKALFGSDPYAKEELVAEMGASFLAGIAEFEDAGGDQSAAYIGGWLEKFNDDPRFVVNAAAQAQKAVDMILGTTFEDEAPKEQEVAAA